MNKGERKKLEELKEVIEEQGRSIKDFKRTLMKYCRYE